MIQIAVIGITGTILSLAVRSWRPEFSVFIAMVCVVLLLLSAAGPLSEILDIISDLYSSSGYAGKFFPILLKVMAIAFLTDFTAQLCRDAGEQGIASGTEIAGKILILYVSLPVFTSLFSFLRILLDGVGVWNTP